MRDYAFSIFLTSVSQIAGKIPVSFSDILRCWTRFTRSQATYAHNARSYIFTFMRTFTETPHIRHMLLQNDRIWPREARLSPYSLWRCCATTVLLEKSVILIFFVNKIYIACLISCCVLCCLLARQADLTGFIGELSFSKTKTRLHTNFWRARRWKRIHPLKITL